MMVTTEQYEQIRAKMGECPIPGVGDWLERTMDFLADMYGFDKAITFARTTLGDVGTSESQDALMERAMKFLEDVKEDLEDTL